MTGKPIELDELSAAVNNFCQIYDNCSYVKPGPEMFEVTVEGEKAMVSLKDGMIECPRKPELKEKLVGIILDNREGVTGPKEATKSPGKGIMPSEPRKSGNGAITQPWRDVQVSDLTLDDIKQYICPNATDSEAFTFLKLCQARGLNPFLKEAYLIKYASGGPATVVVGKDAFTRRAEMHPKFDGFRAGVIVQSGDEIVEREGTFLKKGEELLGGWAEGHRKDRKIPLKHTISRSEYDTGKSNWQKMPATMVRKVALVQMLRELFSSEFSGMYDQSEMGIDPGQEVTI